MTYDLFYWPTIQGRGEFVRLALEEAGAPYRDLARNPAGMKEMMAILGDKSLARPPFAPPFLRLEAGELVAQVALILQLIGERHGLAPADEAGRRFVHQCQLTVADLVAEVHDTHHPIDTAAYYEDQKPEALKYAKTFREARIPKYLGYFERILGTGGPWLAGEAVSTADLSLFQVMEGLSYAFPRTMAKRRADWPLLDALRGRVAERPNVSAYLASDRRITFNEDGIFRHYPELDG